MKSLITYLQLLRPANIVTSFADILVGFSIVAVGEQYLYAGHSLHLFGLLLLLLLATACLYAGGVVMNDVCDTELDKIERPERAIPSGRISKNHATQMGVLLLFLGIVFGFLVNVVSGFIALIIAVLALTYDAYTKKYLWIGPFNMALCRAFNLLLGISIITGMISIYWPIFFVHLAYISAVTLISKGEVNGGDKKILLTAFCFYTLAIIFVISLHYTPHFHVVHALPFLALLSYFIFSSLLKAIKNPEPGLVRRAVKFGILSLIILDAAMASGYGGYLYGLLMLLILPICLFLGRKFAVT